MGSRRFSDKNFNWSRSRKPGDQKWQCELDEGYPTPRQLLAANAPTLSENKIEGSYSSVLEYVQIHYDLLLEDFMCPLRQALKEFKHRKQRTDTLNGARVYKNVKIKSFKVFKHNGEVVPTCVLDIDATDNVRVEKPTFGSLLVFTRNNLNTEDLFVGTVTSDTTRNPDLIEVRLKIPRTTGKDLDSRNLSSGNFIVIQAEAFFYVYFHVLKAIQRLDVFSFPMKQYIIEGTKETKVTHPEYLSNATLYNIFDKKGVNVLDLKSWPPPRDVDMDESQYTALKKALTEEVAVIQGPPGTGKTYFGVRLAKVLLNNVSVWNPHGETPLLVVCQSNQALDNFLEGLLKYSTNFIRVGDQCQSRQLKPYCLKELVCRDLVRQEAGGRKHGSHLETLLDKIDELRHNLENVTKGIVSLNALKLANIIQEDQVKCFKNEEHFLEWLGFSIAVDRKCQDGDLVVSMEDILKRIYQLQLSEDYLATACMYEEILKVHCLIEDFKEGSRQEPLEGIDLLSFTPDCVKNMYFLWLDAYCSHLEDKLDHCEEQLKILWDRLPGKQRALRSHDLLQSTHVVGLTSTGAASRRNTIEDLESPIVIVEEAAEVLESHVVISMTEKCKHLIMLGDHKQLKPGVTTHHLASKFHLNISLFERLLNNEIVEGTCLTKQYRMRPEISSLLKPHIYKTLDDASVTKGRPCIRGLAKNMFFLNHQVAEKRTDGDTGCWNHYEVDMLIGLAKYLVSSGYAPSDITIISMYAEQKRKLIEARDKFPALRSMVIASVDSFQGKENEIVLVSLVRSNRVGNIGFLKQENRICVALSRARSGMYIMGDMACLTKRSEIWRHVHRRLEEKGSIGPRLTLVCPHKSVHHVSKIGHWEVKFCRLCVRNDDKKTTPTASKPSKIVLPPLAQSPTQNQITACTCCQSFYCNKLAKATDVDLEISSVFARLRISEDPAKAVRQACAENVAGNLTSEKTKKNGCLVFSQFKAAEVSARGIRQACAENVAGNLTQKTGSSVFSQFKDAEAPAKAVRQTCAENVAGNLTSEKTKKNGCPVFSQFKVADVSARGVRQAWGENVTGQLIFEKPNGTGVYSENLIESRSIGYTLDKAEEKPTSDPFEYRDNVNLLDTKARSKLSLRPSKRASSVGPASCQVV